MCLFWTGKDYFYCFLLVFLSQVFKIRYSQKVIYNLKQERFSKIIQEQGWHVCNYRCKKKKKKKKNSGHLIVKTSLTGKPATNIHTWCTYIVFWLSTAMPICFNGTVPTYQLVGQFQYAEVPNKGFASVACITLKVTFVLWKEVIVLRY